MKVRLALLLGAICLGVQQFFYRIIALRNPVSLMDSDSAEYLACARQFALYGNFDHHACLVRPPTYPVILALADTASGRMFPAVLINHLLVTLAAVILFAVLSRFLTQTRAFAFSLFFGLDLVLLKYTNTILSEPAFILFFTASLACLGMVLEKGRWFTGLILCAVLQSVSVLIRPIAMLWPWVQAALLAFWIFRPQKEKTAGALKPWLALAIYLLITVGTQLVWSEHNARVFGYRTLSKVGIDQLVGYRMASILEHGPFDTREEALSWIEKRTVGKLNGKALTSQSAEKIYKVLFFEIVRDHPAAFVAAEFHSFWRILFGGVVPEFAAKGEKLRVLHRIMKHTYTVAFILFFVLVVYGMVRKFRDVSPGTPEPVLRFSVLTAAMIMVYFLVMGSPGGMARFKIPFLPAFYFLAAIGYDSLPKKLRVFG
ncbi:MAG: hypothetical protein A2Z83_06095 [Omnitrophica bacterium GWA2_52_8]|nr:MAG: hypothetical protein A2Z83_06095 [Omnitrophica bacterium GWA2_52_8]